jgi:hypothetical protein
LSSNDLSERGYTELESFIELGFAVLDLVFLRDDVFAGRSDVMTSEKNYTVIALVGPPFPQKMLFSSFFLHLSCVDCPASGKGNSEIVARLLFLPSLRESIPATSVFFSTSPREVGDLGSLLIRSSRVVQNLRILFCVNGF